MVWIIYEFSILFSILTAKKTILNTILLNRLIPTIYVSNFQETMALKTASFRSNIL